MDGTIDITVPIEVAIALREEFYLNIQQDEFFEVLGKAAHDALEARGLLE